MLNNIMSMLPFIMNSMGGSNNGGSNVNDMLRMYSAMNGMGGGNGGMGGGNPFGNPANMFGGMGGSNPFANFANIFNRTGGGNFNAGSANTPPYTQNFGTSGGENQDSACGCGPNPSAECKNDAGTGSNPNPGQGNAGFGNGKGTGGMDIATMMQLLGMMQNMNNANKGRGNACTNDWGYPRPPYSECKSPPPPPPRHFCEPHRYACDADRYACDPIRPMLPPEIAKMFEEMLHR
jgi:hypothetical protein